MNELSDSDLEKFDWYELRDTLYLPAEGMYSQQIRKIQLRILTQVKPQSVE